MTRTIGARFLRRQPLPSPPAPRATQPEDLTMTTTEDDRKPEQKESHRYGVAMTDAFMSGWGGASGGASVAIWACPSDWLAHVEDCVRRRGEARRVRVVDLKTYRPRGNVAHVHVYVVEPGHVYAPVGVIA